MKIIKIVVNLYSQRINIIKRKGKLKKRMRENIVVIKLITASLIYYQIKYIGYF